MSFETERSMGIGWMIVQWIITIPDKFEMQQASLPQLPLPPQLQPFLRSKSIRSDQFDAMNTYPSTQQTARQEPRQKLPTITFKSESNNHITIIDSPKNVITLQQGAQFDRRQGYNEDDGRCQGDFKSQKKIEWLGSSSRHSSSKPARRNKIFDSNYFSKRVTRPAQQIRSLKHHNSDRNFFQRSQYPFNHPLNLKESVMTPIVREDQAKRFIDSIPLVPNSTLIRVNSCSQMARPEPVMAHVHSNKIKFTYTQPQSQPQLQHPPLITTANTSSIPTRSYPVYTSTVIPVYSQSQLQSQQQNHHNPAVHKIKKPNPTQRKGTLIDEIKQCPAQARSFAQQNQPVYESVGSKISLGNNIRENLMGGSLATDCLKMGEQLSNIENDHSQRYFDEEEEDILFGKRISYKNIDIPDQKQENVEPHEVHIQNIFSDFEHSRRQERETFERDQQNKPEQRQVSPILEQSTLNLPDKPNPIKEQIPLPTILIGLAALLLLIQLLG